MSSTEPCAQCGRPTPVHQGTDAGPPLCAECGGEADDPEPILDAELVVPLPAPDPIIEPSPIAGADDPPRRPCPMCGESIVATAARCRFCGEVFDDRLRKVGRTVGRQPAAEFAAQRTRLFVCMFLAFGGIVVCGSVVHQARADPSPVQIPVFLAAAAIYLAASITAVIALYRLVAHMTGKVAATLVAAIGLVPCLGLLVDLLVYQRALEFDSADSAPTPELAEDL